MAAKEIASKKLKQTWTTAVFALALKQTKNKIWSSSLSANADVKKGTAVLEQHASYVTEANPLGVGAHVGIVEHDGVDPDKKADKDSLDVLWFDKQRIAWLQTSVVLAVSSEGHGASVYPGPRTSHQTASRRD